ncbi:DUF554 domain-containing protein [Vibrio sp. RC27]
MLFGPILNGVAVIIGGIGGATIGERIPKRMRDNLPMIFGLACIGLGLVMTGKVAFLPAVILSLVSGSIIGESINLERIIDSSARGAKKVVDGLFKANTSDLSEDEYMERFIAVTVLFCASATGVFGAMNEGMTGDASLLITKSFLDLFTAAIFAISLGFPVAAIALPQFIVQAILYFGAQSILPLTTPEMIADFSAVGGLIMFATGTRICGILSFPIASMLPALVVAMPISFLWATYAV